MEDLRPSKGPEAPDLNKSRCFGGGRWTMEVGIPPGPAMYRKERKEKEKEIILD